jgi:hypothetical protein
MGRVVGTPRNMMIEGITYTFAADANVTMTLSIYENVMLPTSGSGMLQKTKRTPTAESVVLITTTGEADQIRRFAEATELLNMSVTLADGSAYACRGQIELENRETDTGRTTIQVLPEEEWTLFEA